MDYRFREEYKYMFTCMELLQSCNLRQRQIDFWGPMQTVNNIFIYELIQTMNRWNNVDKPCSIILVIIINKLLKWSTRVNWSLWLLNILHVHMLFKNDIILVTYRVNRFGIQFVGRTREFLRLCCQQSFRWTFPGFVMTSLFPCNAKWRSSRPRWRHWVKKSLSHLHVPNFSLQTENVYTGSMFHM